MIEKYLCRTIGHWLMVEASSSEEAGRKSRATPLEKWSGHTAHNPDRACSRCVRS